jgi:two-component system chemotaxis response regulator CheB
MPDSYILEQPLSFSCPECGGVLRPDDKGGIRCYRCHIGHVLTAEAVLAAQFDVLEIKLGGCLALLNERADLCNKLADDARVRGEDPARFEAAARESLARTEPLKKMLEADWVHPLGMSPGRAELARSRRRK